MAECSEAFSPNSSRGRISRLLPARPAADRVLGPGFSAEREPWGRRQLLFPPRSPRAPCPPPGVWLQRPQRERRIRLRLSGAASLLSRWPPLASVARIKPCGVGQGEGSPVGRSSHSSRRSPISSLGQRWLGEGSNGACPTKPGKATRGTRVFFKVSRNPSAAGGGWRGCARLSGALASPRLFSPETLTLGL